MPLLAASQCLSLLRTVLSDTDTSGSGRWQDTALLGFIDRGNKRIVRDVLFPDARLTTPTLANVQGYQLPLILQLQRVYVAGQISDATD